MSEAVERLSMLRGIFYTKDKYQQALHTLQGCRINAEFEHRAFSLDGKDTMLRSIYLKTALIYRFARVKEETEVEKDRL